jgi:hypothetical protein
MGSGRVLHPCQRQTDGSSNIVGVKTHVLYKSVITQPLPVMKRRKWWAFRLARSPMLTTFLNSSISHRVVINKPQQVQAAGATAAANGVPRPGKPLTGSANGSLQGATLPSWPPSA